MKTTCAVLLLILLVACNKERANTIFNCDNLKQSLWEQNDSLTAIEMEKLLSTLAPQVDSTDVYGHEENLRKVARSINQCCGLSAEVFCYNCIETLPPQSEIRIQIQNQGQLITRLMDLAIGQDGKLKCLGTHD